MSVRELARVLHWGPLLALFVISEITLSGLYCLLQWWPISSPGGFIHLVIYLNWDVLILYNFFGAMYAGPGYVKKKWTPPKQCDTKCLQFCNMCEGYKAPRSHHCRKCQRCVMKMDHHCPWINNCVGHRNHALFTQFVFFAPLGCIHALCVLAPSLYRAINRQYYLAHGRGKFPIVSLGLTGFFSCTFSIGLALGVVTALSGLFFFQMKSILKNETGIEGWIKDKAEYRERREDEGEFVFPYDLGRWRNFTMVFHLMDRPELTGVWWPVREGCNQYTLTIEQIRQKQEKKERSVIYTIRSSYSGSFFPITQGPRVCCCPPCTDEPRIAVSPGDKVLVSRWKKRWLYGDKLLDEFDRKEVKRIRGWFPRHCAVHFMEQTSENGQTTSENHDNALGDHLNEDAADSKKDQ